MGAGQIESAASLLQVREVRAVAEQWHYSDTASATGREDAGAIPLFLFFLCSLVGTVTVIYTSLLSSLCFHYIWDVLHILDTSLFALWCPKTSSAGLPRLHSPTDESLTFCGLCLVRVYTPAWSRASAVILRLRSQGPWPCYCEIQQAYGTQCQIFKGE